MDNVIKSMYVTINSPAGLSSRGKCPRVRAEWDEEMGKHGDKKEQERRMLQNRADAAGTTGF